MFLYVFFFFQAEDGIRDTSVTGVQTCALPICERPGVSGGVRDFVALTAFSVSEPEVRLLDVRALLQRLARRSEERRVGKECSARWLAGRYDTKCHLNRQVHRTPARRSRTPR